ncbi:MAG: hypothetical protein IPO39_18935 [Bacteroidetes bacterium]|nr:hypothetical protein [Bacteroidota bacterium]
MKNSAMYRNKYRQKPRGEVYGMLSIRRSISGAFRTATGRTQAFGVESETAIKLAQQVSGCYQYRSRTKSAYRTQGRTYECQGCIRLTTTATVAATTAHEALAVSEGAAAVGAEGAAVATKSFTAGLLTNPIFLAVTAIAALAGAYLLLKDDVEDANKQLETKAKIQGEVVKQTDAERRR